MSKNTLTVELPVTVNLPTGEEATTAVVGLLTVKDRMELNKKFRGQGDILLLEMLIRRLKRLGSLTDPIAREIIESLPTNVFDMLIDATMALDSGYDTVESFRKSEEYQRMG